MKVPLANEELYTELTCQSKCGLSLRYDICLQLKDNDGTVCVSLTFAYTPGGKIERSSHIPLNDLFAGDLRERVEEARRITEDQKVLLDKIRRVYRFFESLEVACRAVGSVSNYLAESAKY